MKTEKPVIKVSRKFIVIAKTAEQSRFRPNLSDTTKILSVLDEQHCLQASSAQLILRFYDFGWPQTRCWSVTQSPITTEEIG